MTAAAINLERLAGRVANDLYGRRQAAGFDRDDLYSGALWGVVRALDKHDPAKPLTSTYLCHSARWYAVHLAKQKMRLLSHCGPPDRETPGPAAIAPAVTAGELARVFGLDARDAEIFRRRYVDGATFRDIARSLGLCRETVEGRHKRAVARVRQTMTRDEAARRLGVC